VCQSRLFTSFTRYASFFYALVSCTHIVSRCAFDAHAACIETVRTCTFHTLALSKRPVASNQTHSYSSILSKRFSLLLRFVSEFTSAWTRGVVGRCVLMRWPMPESYSHCCSSESPHSSPSSCVRNVIIVVCCCSSEQNSREQDHGGQGGQGFICPRVGACTCGEGHLALWYVGVRAWLICRCLCSCRLYALAAP
jgi:hypothetical protein